jgi:hypothetical protein
MPLTAVFAIIQAAIGPVILVSGVGLLLLSTTNRPGRIVDRSRQLTHQLRGAPQRERASVIAQIDILWRWARLVRTASGSPG